MFHKLLEKTIYESAWCSCFVHCHYVLNNLKGMRFG